MCDLESQFGDDFSPEDIAAIARGEGGTAKLFEPIAKRAAKEIEKQLDAAESSINDPLALDVLKHVRKIVSGELVSIFSFEKLLNMTDAQPVSFFAPLLLLDYRLLRQYWMRLSIF